MITLIFVLYWKRNDNILIKIRFVNSAKYQSWEVLLILINKYYINVYNRKDVVLLHDKFILIVLCYYTMYIELFDNTQDQIKRQNTLLWPL